MHVVYIIHQFYPYHYSGTERVVLGSALYMQKLGHKVTILTYSHEEDENYFERIDEILIKNYLFEGLRVIAVKSNEPYYNSSYFIESESSVYEHIIKKIAPDIVHVAHLMYMNSFLTAAKKLDIPYVVSLTDFWFICHRAQMVTTAGKLCSGPNHGKQCKEICLGLEKDYYEKRFECAETILRESKANITSSHFLQNTFTHVMPSFQSTFIPYGLNFSYLDVNTTTYTPQSTIRFLFAATLSKHKGIDLVIKTFKSLKNKNFILNIYGDGPLQNFVMDEIKGIETIRYFGKYAKEETKKLIQSNDVVLIPSAWYENNPIILQEMVASNIPAIVSNVGSLPEMVEHNKTGFIFEMSNAESLREIVESIIENPVQLNDIKLSMHTHTSIITIEQQVLQYVDIYEAILKEST